MDRDDIIIIVMMGIVLFFVLLTVGSLIVSSLHTKKLRNKWNASLVHFPQLHLMVVSCNMLFDEYEEYVDKANNIQTQIDSLLLNINYYPSFERTRREQQAEEYKQMYLEYYTISQQKYKEYETMHKMIGEFCETNNIHRM